MHTLARRLVVEPALDLARIVGIDNVVNVAEDHCVDVRLLKDEETEESWQETDVEAGLKNICYKAC